MEAHITIRPALPDDAKGIARAFTESAEHHARLDSERYFVPSKDAIAARYRDGRQHPPEAAATSVTLVAEIHGEVVGFVDARLEQSTDAMHRELVYCHVIEIAVEQKHQSAGVGARLLQAAEEWGRERGAHLASLEYLASNTRAARFYQQRMGYHVAAITAIKRL